MQPGLLGELQKDTGDTSERSRLAQLRRRIFLQRGQLVQQSGSGGIGRRRGHGADRLGTRRAPPRRTERRAQQITNEVAVRGVARGAVVVQRGIVTPVRKAVAEEQDFDGLGCSLRGGGALVRNRRDRERGRDKQLRAPYRATSVHMSLEYAGTGAPPTTPQ